MAAGGSARASGASRPSLEFTKDADRFIWIATEARKQLIARATVKKRTALIRDLAQEAFGYTIEELRENNRSHPIVDARQKMICLLWLTAPVTWGQLELMFDRTAGSIVSATRKYKVEIAEYMGDLVIRRANSD